MDTISSSSYLQTPGITFERMNKYALYTGERHKFLSICDEWYKVLEHGGLMTSGQEDLLRQWIIERQYANIKDSVVSMVIVKCSIAKKEEKKRKKEEAMQRRKNKESEQKEN